MSNLVLCLLKQFESLVLSRSIADFPLSTLWDSTDPELAQLERMGGLLSHLLSNIDKDQLALLRTRAPQPTAEEAEDYALFNRTLILFNYILKAELVSTIQGLENYVGRWD